MTTTYVVLSSADLVDRFSSLEDADATATYYARCDGKDQYVYKLHKVYRLASAKDDPEIVYVDP